MCRVPARSDLLRGDCHEQSTTLIVSVDTATVDELCQGLRSEGHHVIQAGSGSDARRLLQTAHPSLVMLDLALPDVYGLILCAHIRRHCDVPIIVFGDDYQSWEPTLSLQVGADHFMEKPVDVTYLRARVAALLRRKRPARTPDTDDSGVIRVGHLVIDPGRGRASLGDVDLRLPPVEFRLASALAAHVDQTLTRKQIAAMVWRRTDPRGERLVDVAVRRLRSRLAHGPVRPPAIVAVRGTGYQMTLSQPLRRDRERTTTERSQHPRRRPTARPNGPERQRPGAPLTALPTHEPNDAPGTATA